MFFWDGFNHQVDMSATLGLGMQGSNFATKSTERSSMWVLGCRDVLSAACSEKAATSKQGDVRHSYSCAQGTCL